MTTSLTTADDAGLPDVPTLVAAVDGILRLAGRCLGSGDLKRAADRMGRLAAGKFSIPSEDRAFAMIGDLAMFEPNDQGIRPFDRFLAGPAERLSGFERDLARRMGNGFFSIFRCAEPHPEHGLWLADIFENDRRIWLGDTTPESPDVIGRFIATRIFDAGPYHAQLVRPTPPGPDMVHICLDAAEQLGRQPFSRSLAATVYGIAMPGEIPDNPSGRKFQRDLIDSLKRHNLLPPPDNASFSRAMRA